MCCGELKNPTIMVPVLVIIALGIVAGFFLTLKNSHDAGLAKKDLFHIMSAACAFCFFNTFDLGST